MAGDDHRGGWTPVGDAGGWVELPDLVRRAMAARPSQLTGVAQVGSVEVSFNLGAGGTVACVWVTVSGPDGPAEAALELLRRPGWVLSSPEPLEVKTVEPNQSPDLSGGATLYLKR